MEFPPCCRLRTIPLDHEKEEILMGQPMPRGPLDGVLVVALESMAQPMEMQILLSQTLTFSSVQAVVVEGMAQQRRGMAEMVVLAW